MIDCHVHTDYTIDSNMSIEDAVKRASELGLEYMCFTQHLELTHLKPGEVAMDPGLIGEYFKRVEKAGEEYGVNLGTGIEVGYVAEKYNASESILEEYPFDFVIGSVHEIQKILVNHTGYIKKMGELGAENFVDRYFEKMDEMIELGFFDVVGHFDVLNKCAQSAFGKDILPLYRERASESAKLLKKKGKGFEVNTQGIRRIGLPWPRTELTRDFHVLGIEIVSFGSDAHEVDQIGYGWDEVMGLLRNAGFTELSYFVQRKRKSYKIPKKA